MNYYIDTLCTSHIAAAHLLSGTHNVTIFEANELGGLSGAGVDVYGHTIDIPLRIIGEGWRYQCCQISRRHSAFTLGALVFLQS